MAIIMSNCTTCGGSGLVMADAPGGGGLVRNETCPTCKGRKVISVRVPDPPKPTDEDK